MKEKIKNILNKALSVLKTAVFLLIMFMGIWAIYSMIWLGFGLPDANWAMWLLAALAFVSEYLVLRFF